MGSTSTISQLKCYHCGDECLDDSIRNEEKIFCCEGCKLVHELLEEKKLCTYYNLSDHPGQKPSVTSKSERFGWLDDESVLKELLSFSENNIAVVSFLVPQIHCASCIWLLENMSRMNNGIITSRVNFSDQTVTITFNRNRVSLRRIVELMSQIGYEPDIRFSDIRRKLSKRTDRSLIYKIGVAGFCFGNIMMLSFPEYLSGTSEIDPALKHFFSYLNLLLALPVFFFSAGDYFTNSWKAARQKYFSIDLPIALGLTAMLIRSCYEIISHAGPGFFDSMSGLVFFLLIGRYFQSLTFKNMSFEHNYHSYFPAAVSVKKNGSEISTAISKLKVGDKIIIHNEELIPADAVLLNGEARIDYSFVTGESTPIHKQTGELLYAGGKQRGPVIELEVLKTVDQSYLTQLWNHESFKKEKYTSLSSLADRISKYFTITIILIAVVTAFYWIPKDVNKSILAASAILIIACPCALAITVPFTFGNMIRLLGRKNFYLKNAGVAEAIAKTDTIVFDKTGTITQQKTERIFFNGEVLTDFQRMIIRNLATHSIHPFSKLICDFIPGTVNQDVKAFKEIPGAGIEGMIAGVFVRIGSRSFIQNEVTNKAASDSSKVFVSIDGRHPGFFQINNRLRKGLKEEIASLSKKYDCWLLSGDHDGERKMMEEVFQKKENLMFRRSPQDKLNFISNLQSEEKNVMMIGDGLNDAGALQQSNVGIVVSDNTMNFSPACDAIIEGDKFDQLHHYLKFCKQGIQIIWFTFGISLLYNLAGIYFAVQGDLSPMIAAILMPISSISVILITTLATKWRARNLH